MVILFPHTLSLSLSQSFLSKKVVCPDILWVTVRSFIRSFVWLIKVTAGTLPENVNEMKWNDESSGKGEIGSIRFNCAKLLLLEAAAWPLLYSLTRWDSNTWEKSMNTFENISNLKLECDFVLGVKFIERWMVGPRYSSIWEPFWCWLSGEECLVHYYGTHSKSEELRNRVFKPSWESPQGQSLFRVACPHKFVPEIVVVDPNDIVAINVQFANGKLSEACANTYRLGIGGYMFKSAIFTYEHEIH